VGERTAVVEAGKDKRATPSVDNHMPSGICRALKFGHLSSRKEFIRH